MAQINANGNINSADLTIPQPTSSTNKSLATLGVHGDDEINYYIDVAPALHVATTFRYPHDPDKLVPEQDQPLSELYPLGKPIRGDAHIYSRLTAPNASRLESILTQILSAPTLTYSSGLAAFHALLTWLHPKVVAIGAGYHGCHGVLRVYQKLTRCAIVDLFDETTWGALGPGDVVHLETPVNPTGRAFDIQHFADAAHARGAWLTIDATFAPPPLQDPWAWGADFVMHSGTKYLGGHSDMLCGVLAVGTQRRTREEWEKDYWGLFGERVYLGSVMGSMEGWLGVRSMRTFELRVKRQSENAGRLVQWLSGCLDGSTSEGGDAAEAVRKVVSKLEHASLQRDDMYWLGKQMPNGFGPVFSMLAKSKDLAKRLPSKLHLFHHATSLGGVESLIEWRAMSDDTVEPELLRISVGVEAFEDLKDDLIQGFRTLAAEGTA